MVDIFAGATNSLMIGDDASMISQAGGTLKNVLLGATALIFFLAGLVYIYASYIVPQAARQLELEAKELAPEIW